MNKQPLWRHFIQDQAVLQFEYFLQRYFDMGQSIQEWTK